MKKKKTCPSITFWRCRESAKKGHHHKLVYSWRSLRKTWCPICAVHVHSFENENAMKWTNTGIIHIADTAGEIK